MLTLPPALLENWMRDYYFRAEVDIGSSGVEDFGFAELRALLGIGCEALDEIVFRDSETLGGAELREALAARWTGGAVERVMVTHGSSEANFLLMTALLRAGDEVVVLDPGYQQLHAIAEALGCRLRRWPLRFERGFEPDLDDLRALLTPRTRMVVVNFPHNPTGASLTPGGQRELIEAVASTGAYLLWDGAFADLAYDRPLPDPVLLYDRACSLGTLSKAYGLPGLRVGWCLAAPEVLGKMVRVRDYLTLHLSPMVELVARRVIEEADRIVGMRMELARRNRAIVAAWMDEHAEWVRWAPPPGGVCAFPRLLGIPDTEAFCRTLAEAHGVLLVPGECFGAPGHVRLGFGRDTAVVRDGLDRLSAGLRAHLHAAPARRAEALTAAPG
ncbi:MAG TPA: capreomycidine synthase [Longimicrobium sp.]|nr:capreomycidine synthase [Longimicrobium sp.]